MTLPVHGHSTMFVCIRAYSVVGNVAVECKQASTVMKIPYNTDTVYDVDINSDSWQIIKEVIQLA